MKRGVILAVVACALANCATQHTTPPYWGAPPGVNVCTFPCWLGYELFLSPYAFGSDPNSPQRIQQGISRTMNACFNTAWAKMFNSNALERRCRAERACLAAGLPKGCAFDDEALETTTSGSVGPVGDCE